MSVIDQAELGLTLKTRGQNQAAHAHAASLEIARNIAVELSTRYGHSTIVTADDVRAVFIVRHPSLAWKNFAGLIFKGRQWKCQGFTPSKTAVRRGGMLRQWIYQR